MERIIATKFLGHCIMGNFYWSLCIKLNSWYCFQHPKKNLQLTKPKFKTVKEVIEDGYYQEQKDNIDTDVIVFGHTHFAGSYEIKKETKRKLFLNSGCWVGEDAELSENMRM